MLYQEIMIDQNFRNLIREYPECDSPLWLRGGHRQTLWGHFISPPRLEFIPETVQIPVSNGDELVCYLHRGTSHLVVCLCHGLAGSSNSNYIIRMGNALVRAGHSVLLMNHRGAHFTGRGEALQMKELYHSGRSDDFSKMFQWIRNEMPGKFVVGAGFSMSANIMLLNLAGYKSDYQPDFGIAVNAPINLADASSRLDSGFCQLYARNFTKDLGNMRNINGLKMSLKEFDDTITAPSAGFRDRNDYYEQCSAIKYISNIKAPALVLTAEDDPFISSEFYKQVKWPDNVVVRIEKVGGHLGYIQRPTDSKSIRWMDDFLIHAIAEIYKRANKAK